MPLTGEHTRSTLKPRRIDYPCLFHKSANRDYREFCKNTIEDYNRACEQLTEMLLQNQDDAHIKQQITRLLARISIISQNFVDCNETNFQRQQSMISLEMIRCGV